MGTKAREVKAKPKGGPGQGAVPPPALPPGCDAMLSKVQICFAVGVSRRTFDSMLSAGEYPAHDAKIGPYKRWHVATHNAWVARQCGKG